MLFRELTPGRTVLDKNIMAYKTISKSSEYLYLLAGVHGDEVEGIYILKKIFDWLRNENDLEEIPMIVIPILNVDGHDLGTRVNAHEVDLNRNFPTKDWSKVAKEKKYFPGEKPGSEPENQFLMKLMDKFHPSLIMTFHSWKRIINYNGDCKEIADFIQKYNRYETSPDIGYDTPGSLGTYAPEKYSTPVLTFEAPTLEDVESLESIWKESEEGLLALFKSNIFASLKAKIKS